MNTPFKVGEICIGQNFVHQTYLNGMECEIIGGLEWRHTIGRTTGARDTELCYRVRWADGSTSVQPPSNLRRRPPPTTGEDKIIALFSAPPVERRQPVTAWQAQYDTAQVLMKMGVRVKPGKWPVEAV